jgi:hypothetical protein
VSGAREQTEGLTRQVMSLPVVPETSGFGLAGSLPRRAARAEAVIPTTEDLTQQAHAAYQAADKAGVTISQPTMQSIARDVAQTAVDNGVDPVLHPRATRAVTILNESAEGGPRTLLEIDRLRRTIGMAGRSLDPDERRIASIMMDRLDDQISRLSPNDVTSGDVKAGTQALQQGRELWNRMRKSERIETIVADAQNRAVTSGTGGNVDNTIRQGIAGLLRNPKLARLYTDEEKTLLQKVARGGPVQNLMRLVGRISPKSGALPLLANVAAVAHDPLSLVATTGATVAKALGDTATARNVGRALDRIRAGASIENVRKGMTAQEWAALMATGALRGQQANTARGLFGFGHQSEDER